MPEEYTGIVGSIIYQNEENGYTVMEMICDGDYLVCTGTVGNLYPGEKITVYGSWVLNSTYGQQLKIDNIKRELPETSEEMLSFLSSGLIKGIREKTARKIVEAFGDESFEIIKNHPDRLTRIEGLSKDKAKEISKAFVKLDGERNALMNLEKYGISSSQCINIFREFGPKCVEIVENNPYSLCNIGIGITFEKANQIASMLPVKPADQYRIQAGIIYILRFNIGNGHTCCPREKLIQPCIDLLQVDEDTVNRFIDALVEAKQLISKYINIREFIFLPEMYNAEKSACESLLFVKRFATKTGNNTDEDIQRASLIGGVVYNDKQQQAIKTAVEKGILVLTGGPGTGKTTTLRGILRVFESQNLDVALAAPTGRAAKRMSELTGKEAKTIHRLLEVEWDEKEHSRFTRNKRNPLTADAVIIDELSMVDISLFSALLDALPIGCRLIMVGDSDQLPPVGPGNVLHDIIESGVLPVIELTEVFRQAMESMIIRNAHAIVNGEYPELDCKDKDFFFIEKESPMNASDTIVDLCVRRLPKAYDYTNLEDIQVLCPSKKGETGTIKINKNLQNMINPSVKGKKEHQFGSRVFRENDKVMQTKNNYDISWSSENKTGQGIFNGDIGVIEKIDEVERVFIIKFDDRKAVVPFENQLDLDHAYAITVHKSQGNEFPCVVIPVVGINDLLKYRNLFYTAVTRAKNMIVLVGKQQCVKDMVDNNKKQKRYSALKFFLSEDSKKF